MVVRLVEEDVLELSVHAPVKSPANPSLPDHTTSVALQASSCSVPPMQELRPSSSVMERRYPADADGAAVSHVREGAVVRMAPSKARRRDECLSHRMKAIEKSFSQVFGTAQTRHGLRTHMPEKGQRPKDKGQGSKVSCCHQPDDRFSAIMQSLASAYVPRIMGPQQPQGC